EKEVSRGGAISFGAGGCSSSSSGVSAYLRKIEKASAIKLGVIEVLVRRLPGAVP
ncbi:hypothetical protein LINPERHAP2_LOCUS39150, partial [Linum perenne]